LKLKFIKVAIVGCCHGTMSSLYASIKKTERTYNVKVDLVIICGDFQVNKFLILFYYKFFLIYIKLFFLLRMKFYKEIY